MKKPFREHHLRAIFASYDKQNLPLDLFLKNYFKSNKAIGSHDRKFLAETIYGMIRWMGLLDYQLNEHTSWERRSALFATIKNPLDFVQDTSIPLHHRLSFPLPYFETLVERLGEEKTQEFCLESNFPAPTTVRANLLKTSRDALLQLWQPQYPVSPCLHSPSGIVFDKRINLFGLDEFAKGFFEVQDEASQLVAGLVQAKPGELVLDYCSGSGGKTLAFAPPMQNKGQIYLHDIRNASLLEAKKRLNRAGIQNAQICLASDKKMDLIKNKMDWVLVDSPCSGSGTLRRNPDMKWKFTKARFAELLLMQKEIISEAISYVRPGGKLVYATCSVLPQENEDQVTFIQNQFPMELLSAPFQSFPKKGSMDGFFAAVFEKK